LGLEQVRVVPNGVDTAWFTPGGKPSGCGRILFTGQMSYAPNVEAVCYFASEILPEIRRAIADVRLDIVGNKPAPEVQALANGAIVVHGFVPDTRPFYRAADVVIVPLVHGGGTRVKILEAAASGKAIVTTSLGVEGLAFEDGRDLIVCDEPHPFAKAVISLLNDESERERLGLQARENALAYDWGRIQASFRSIIESLA
jgi:glycosyltransferase involved in cell wall biosynthesis